jgi:hypothetical protein
MSAFIVLLIFATAIVIVLLISALLNDFAGLGIFATILLILCFASLWPLGLNTWKTESTLIKVIEVTRGKSAIYVRNNDGKTYTFPSKLDYDNITDTTKFYRREYLNHFGISIKAEIVY